MLSLVIYEGSMWQGCRNRGAGGGGPGGVGGPPQSLSTLCGAPPKKTFHPPTTFWVQVYDSTCMCKQTAGL